MNFEPNPVGDGVPTVSPTPPEQRRGNRLRLARRAWIVLAFLLLAYFVANIPVVYQALSTVCDLPDPASCPSGQPTLGNAEALAQLHLSLEAYMGFNIALTLVGSLLFGAVGVLIFLRASRDWNGLFFPLLFLLLGATQPALVISGTSMTGQESLILQGLVAVSNALSALQLAFITALVVTFPTGRLNPRWSWALIVLAVVEGVLPTVVLAPTTASYTAVLTVVALTLVATVGVQVYRYLRIYDAVQRQQTKWFVFAVGIGVALSVITILPGAVVPSLGAPDSWYQLLSNPMSSATLLLLPLGVGIAILRYRLWDVDVLINRALVYGSLTALLAALYIGLIVALQAMVRATTGSLSQQPLVLVASTLAIAALVQPLRRRVQITIDGRFYRRKYDAAQVVAAFSSTLRQEVDLDQLRDQLVAVVEETMQPTHVAL